MGKRKSGFKIGQAAVLLLLFLLVMGNIHPYVLHADPPAQIEGEWIQSSNGRWWYRHTDGSYTSDGWEYINGHWYHFDSAGWMQTGWLQVNSTWYYLSSSGAMVTGWEYIDSNWYYFSSSGAMCTGWQYINDAWYYFASGGAMCKGWQYINEDWYYFNYTGTMRTDPLWLSPKYYTFFSSGRLQSTRIMIDRQEQEQPKWCWAACAVMVGKYQTDSTKTQSDVVLYVKHQIINESAYDWETNQALYYASDFTKFGSLIDTDDFSFDEAVFQIDTNKLFIMRMDWNNGGAHIVVGAGYQYSPDSIYIIDPLGNCANDYFPYNGLKQGMGIHSGTGRWTLAIKYTIIN